MPSTVLLGGRCHRKGVEGRARANSEMVTLDKEHHSAIRSNGTSVCLVSFFLLVEMTLRRVKRVLIVKRDE